MEPAFKKIMKNAIAVTGMLFGISKKIDYKTLNRYIIGMNECLTLDNILLEASRCLKDILNYQLFAFAVQGQDQLDVWIDPRMYQQPLSKVIERDFGANSAQHIHFFNDDSDDTGMQMTFNEASLVSHVIMNHHGLARLYVLPKRRMMPYHDEILDTIVKTLGVALNNCMNIKRLESDVALDPLTGCYNRREFDRLIEHHIAAAQRHEKVISLIMFDIDHFKQVNDTFGHPAGDAVLAQVAAAIRNAIRKGDYLVRYGGEEFVVVLPDTRIRRAMGLAGRLRRILETLDIRLPDGKIIQKTASFGVASLKPGWDGRCLLKEADTMLYQAKALGRNVVMPKFELCFPESRGFSENPVPVG
jgi:diguanylate cyclase (GGDEF)-like protein